MALGDLCECFDHFGYTINRPALDLQFLCQAIYGLTLSFDVMGYELDMLGECFMSSGQRFESFVDGHAAIFPYSVVCVNDKFPKLRIKKIKDVIPWLTHLWGADNFGSRNLPRLRDN
jgi:hypothetical protein